MIKHIYKFFCRYFLVIAAIVFTACISVYLYLVWDEKRDFANAEKEMQAFATLIQQEVGQADEIKTNKSCGRANLKSSSGPLVCNINYYLVFDQTSVERANEILRSITKHHHSEVRPNSVNTMETNKIEFTTEDNQSYVQSLMEWGGLKCSMGSDYNNKVKSNIVSTSNSVVVGLYCSKGTLKQLYSIL